MKGMFAFVFSFFCFSNIYAGIASGADKLINQIDPSMNIGIEVLDLTTGQQLFQRNANRFFIPASNMKLFSDAAALMVLGPDYRFKNQLTINHAKLQKNILTGALYLQLPGDPSFSHERLAHLIHSLKKWQINRIQGNVIIDSGHANVNAYAPGWMAEDLAYSYAAPIAPVMIDANRTMVTVNPAGKVGEAAVVEVDDPSGGIGVINQVVTKESGKNCGIDFSMSKENQLTVRGCVGIGQWAVVQKMAIQNPLIYAQALIRKQLADANIVLEGSVLLGNMPSGSLLLAGEQSKPIAQLMADTLKPSDNLYADSLFLHAAARLQGAPLNWPEAQEVLKKFLHQQTGIDLHNSVLMDGSGLSRFDRLTPAQTVGLLNFLFYRFPLAYEYIAALPISGRDGTLQKRFRKPNQQDLVRAKTGTMKGVVSLSGYLYTANAHTLAFAIFVNKSTQTKSSVSGKFRYLVDALCSYFLQQKPTTNAWTSLFGDSRRIRYQLNPPQAELQRSEQARWRRLEGVVKEGLRGQAVSVLYRGNELILNDSQHDAGAVMSVLNHLNKKYPFAVALSSKTTPQALTKPVVFWTEDTLLPANVQRVWVIREAAK